MERQLAKDTVLQVAYVGVHGVHLTYLRNLNQATQPLDSNFEVCPTPSDPYCADGLASNFGRPYYSTVPEIGPIRTSNNDASMISHSLQVRFEKRFSAGWTMLAAYTYQHSLGVTDENEAVGPEPQNTYDMRAERGDISPDFRHQFTDAWTYELPFGPGKRYFNSKGPARWLAGGWQLNGIVTLYSGQAITPLLSYDDTNTGSGGTRPNIYGDPNSFSNATEQGALRIRGRCNAGTIRWLSVRPARPRSSILHWHPAKRLRGCMATQAGEFFVVRRNTTPTSLYSRCSS